MIPTLESPMRGYRHWTHLNESAKSLEMHGRPSYIMMCLVLDHVDTDTHTCQACGRDAVSSFLDRMMSLQVQNKPTIQQIGASSTPAPKKRLRKNNMGQVSSMTTSPKPGSNNISTTITKIHPTPKTTTNEFIPPWIFLPTAPTTTMMIVFMLTSDDACLARHHYRLSTCCETNS
jgi:hypothetical protein